MTINNKGNLFVFEVGPSVKFVSAIKDAIFKKKNGGNFFVRKNAKLGGGGGGPRGVWQKTRLFPVFFSSQPSLIFTSVTQRTLMGGPQISLMRASWTVGFWFGLSYFLGMVHLICWGEFCSICFECCHGG